MSRGCTAFVILYIMSVDIYKNKLIQKKWTTRVCRNTGLSNI